MKYLRLTLLLLGFVVGIANAGVKDHDEAPLPGPVRLVMDIGRDAGHIYTAPLRMDRSAWLKTAGILSVGAVIYAKDEAIYEGLRDHQFDRLYRPFRDLGTYFEPVGHMGNSNKYYFAGLVGGYLGGFEKLTLVSTQLLESHLIGGFLNNTVQNLVRRQRPYGRLGPYEFGVENATSFMSGHASNYFQDTAIITYHVDNPWFTGAAYTTAVAVAFQRVTSSQHWPSDVFFSAIYGTLVGRTIARRHAQRREILTSLSPTIIDRRVGLAYCGTF